MPVTSNLRYWDRPKLLKLLPRLHQHLAFIGNIVEVVIRSGKLPRWRSQNIHDHKIAPKLRNVERPVTNTFRNEDTARLVEFERLLVCPFAQVELNVCAEVSQV